MGMIRIERGEDINALRGMIQAGLISEDDLKQMTITGGLVSNTPQRVPQQNPTMGGQPQQARKLRVVGYGNGQVTDLGEEEWKAPPLDYTRGGIDIAGVGKGQYGADGRSAYVQTPQGMTKVLLGYDAEASDRRNDMALKRQMARTQLEQEGLQNEGLRQRNAMLAAGPQQTMNDAPQGAMVPSQKQLEQMYGKPDAGMRWKPDGSGLEPLPGGMVQTKADSGFESMRDAIKQIDDMVGVRDKDGKLVGKSAPATGFEDAVGASIAKTFGFASMPWGAGSDTRSFMERLKQAKGGAFLRAFESLKGGGQITEIEGNKATSAITRMDEAQSEAEFIKAASEFRDALESGMKKLGATSGRMLPQAQAVGGGPKMGAVEDGYVFMGGDPKSPSSWKRAR